MGKKKAKLAAAQNKVKSAEQKTSTAPEGLPPHSNSDKCQNLQKKLKKARLTDADKEEKGTAEVVSPARIEQVVVPPSVDKCEHPEDVYDAAAVVFFTRDAAGAVSQVLLAQEDRKVQASYIGLAQKGKVQQRMLLFPMGRREKKDKNDTVETAKREYIEETGDYGGLSKYLDYADFAEDDDDGDKEPGKKVECTTAAVANDTATWSGTGNIALFFAPAKMIVLFCEVPAEAALRTHQGASGGVTAEEQAKRAGAAAAAAAELEKDGEEPAAKKRKKSEKAASEKPSHSYHVGRTDHLEPSWLPATDLRAAILSGERSPTLTVRGEPCRLFPTASSVFRLREAVEWLGLDFGAVHTKDKLPK